MKRTHDFWLIIPLCICVFVLGACVSKKHPGIHTSYYILEYDAPHIDHRPQLNTVIRIERFTVAPLYTTNKMIFKSGPQRRDTYGYHRWRSNPADMVSSMLIRDMRHTELFTAISSPGERYPAMYVLDGSVVDFFEDDGMNPPEAVIQLTITLSNDNETDITKAVLLQKSYTAAQTFRNDTPQAFAEAMSQAMRVVSRRIVVDIHEILTAASEPVP